MAIVIKILFCNILLFLVFISVLGRNETEYVTAVGDPGMRRDGLRVAIEAWNQCNEVGQEAPGMGSPRAADCFDVVNMYPYPPGGNDDSIWALGPKTVVHKVTEEDNKLGIDTPIPGGPPQAFTDIDQYAAQKELYLGSKCQVEDTPNPWQFWMIMLKSGNMDTYAAKCPMNGLKVGPYWPDNRFPCFGPGCANPPTMNHNYTGLYGPNKDILKGSFYGSWDLDANVEGGMKSNKSYYFVKWEKELGNGSWVFHHYLKTSPNYGWLMLYLRSDATTGFSGGYHYETRGMSKIVPESPNFKVRYTLNIIQGGGPASQFYLLDMGSCWKNNGKPCDGDPTTDVTRYSEMILNPDTEPWCKSTALGLCPLYHTFSNGSKVYRNDTKNFPYGAYHLHCAPGNGKYVEKPANLCDPFSNPISQEILQILPHPVWGEYGYPTKQGEGWIGDSRTWELDVGRLSHSLYFYQDPGTPPAKRRWPSIDVGTEIYKDPNAVAEWTVSDFDILIPKKHIC